MLVAHPILSCSRVLEDFLSDLSPDQFVMDKHLKHVEGAFSKNYLLDFTDVFQEDGAIGDFRS